MQEKVRNGFGFASHWMNKFASFAKQSETIAERSKQKQSESELLSILKGSFVSGNFGFLKRLDFSI